MTRNITSAAGRLLASSRFAIVLMLVIAAASIYGTLFPPQTPDDFNPYEHPVFIGLLFLFALNIGWCTVRRVLPAVRARGLWRGRLVLVLHAACVAILLLAGVSKFLDETFTVNVHAGDSTDAAFDWKAGADGHLPFAIRLDKMFIEYYPVTVKVAARKDGSGTTDEIVTKTGEKVRLSDGSEVVFEKADVEAGHLTYRLMTGGGTVTVRSTADASSPGPWRFAMKAYMDPVIKQYHADVSIIERGAVVRSGSLSINRPLDWAGFRIYLTSTGKDDFGLEYGGFQITRKPLMDMIWIACVLLSVSACLYPFFGTKGRGQEVSR